MTAISGSVTTKHALVWNELKGTKVIAPIDRSRDWRCGPYEAKPDEFEGDCLSLHRKAVEVISIRVTYRGSAPINTEILTRQYRHIVDEDLFALSGWLLCCCPCWMLACCFFKGEREYCFSTFCTQMQSKKQKNADLFNQFVVETLSQADREVDRRIAALSNTIHAPSEIAVLSLSTQEEHLAAEVSRLRIEKLQREKENLEAELKLSQAGAGAGAASAKAPSLTEPLLAR